MRTTSIVRAAALAVALLGAACAGGGGGGGSFEIVDAAFEPTAVNNFSSCDTGYSAAQSFTVETSGVITGFDLFLRQIAATGSVTVDLRATISGVPVFDDTTAYEFFTFDVSTLPVSSGFVHFEFSVPLGVTAGDVFALTLRDTIYGSGQLAGWDGQAFPGPYLYGEQYGRAGIYTNSFAVEYGGDGDLGFRTYVIPD